MRKDFFKSRRDFRVLPAKLICPVQFFVYCDDTANRFGFHSGASVSLAPRTGARLVVRQYPSARVHGDRGRGAASAFEAADFGLERYAEAVVHSRSHESGEGEDVG